MIEPINLSCVYPQDKKTKSKRTQTQYKWNRLAFPLAPAVAFTGYKVQGRTLSSGVMDLNQPPGCGGNSQDAYVFLSRFRHKSDVALVRPFPISKLRPIYDANFKLHQEWLYQKDAETEAAFTNDLLSTWVDLPIPRAPPPLH